MNFIVQILMYAAPVVYPTSLIPSPHTASLYALNPMVGVIEGFRSALLSTQHRALGPAGRRHGQRRRYRLHRPVVLPPAGKNLRRRGIEVPRRPVGKGRGEAIWDMKRHKTPHFTRW